MVRADCWAETNESKSVVGGDEGALALSREAGT